MGRPSPTRFPTTFVCRLGFLLLAAVLLAGCDMSGPQSTIHVDGPVARSQLNLFYVTLWVTIFIFVTVGGVLAYAQIRFRARKDDPEETPEQTHGRPAVEIGLIIASALLLVIIAVPTVRGIWYQEEAPAGSNPLVVRVTGFQWWFKFEYPELGVVTANELVLPAGRPVHFDLRTVDVIHSFWIPRLGGKRDLIPNRANSMWLQADRPGYFWGQCAEFCGESHANMKFRAIVLAPEDFEAWVQREKADARSLLAEALREGPITPRVHFAGFGGGADEGQGASDRAGGTSAEDTPFGRWQAMQQPPPAGSEDPALIARGRRLFTEKTCLGCHSIRGHGAMGISGPDLTHFASRTTIAAAMLDNTPENLRAWIADPAAVKPGNLMWRDGYVANNIKLTSEDLDALVAYLLSLK